MINHSHTCQALVLTCIDFRFHEQVGQRLKELGVASFDMKTDAGAVKYIVSDDKPEIREWICENINIATRLHNISELILINHYDCGAYGGNTAFESEEHQVNYHEEQLSSAQSLLSQKFPNLKIKIFFAKPTDDKVDLIAF